jgi:phage RecT family recombinase
MSNIKKALVQDLKNKEVKDIVALVSQVYEKNQLSTELELQFIQLKINESPQLIRAAKANPESLYSSILQAAESGLSLNPQWQEGYLVPYNMKVDGKDVPTVTFSPLYRGKKKLLIIKGIVKNIVTELVYEGEFFEEEIINGVHEIKHKPNSFRRSDPSKIIGGYATITLNNDQLQYVVKGRDYFERCKKASEKKMGGKTSPAWREWYDQMCRKCLINAADSVTPKIGVNAETTQLLNDINTNDVDYVDVTDEDKVEKLTQPKLKLTEKGFSELLNRLFDYEISLNAAKQKLKGYEFTDEQTAQIEKAGTIDEERLTEIIELIIAGKKELTYFEFYLTDEQKELVKNAIIDNEMSKQK